MYKKIIKKAGDALKQHSIGKLVHASVFWDDMEWIEHTDQLLETEAELSRNNDPFVNLYPSLAEHAEPVKLVLIEFGLFLLARGGKRAASIWNKKLCLPSKEQIEDFSNRLKNKQNADTYEALVQAYPDKGHAVDRLVAVHLCNALKHHNIAFDDSTGVDVKTWGPTAEFANRKKYFSLVPLLSAYAPRFINDCFGCTFANLVLKDLSAVIESSTAYALKEVILNVIQRSA